jgi:hypothetical protein
VIPTELSGIDSQELPAGDEAEQLAAHGPEGDAAIPTEGADPEGLTLEEPPAAEEVRHDIDEPE